MELIIKLNSDERSRMNDALREYIDLYETQGYEDDDLEITECKDIIEKIQNAERYSDTI